MTAQNSSQSEPEPKQLTCDEWLARMAELCGKGEAWEKEQARRARRETLKGILRWIAVLPAAVGTYFIVQVISALGNFAVPAVLVQLWNSIMPPIVLVVVGAMVAPGHKFATALVLTILHAAAWTFLITFIWARGVSVSAPLWYLILCGLLGVGATVATCVAVHREGPD